MKFSSASWTADGKGFFYARYDAPKEGAALTGANYFQKLYYHRLGTPQADDVLVAENRDDKEWGFGTQVSDDGELLVISVWKSAGSKNGLMVLPLPKGAFAGGKPQPVTLASTRSTRRSTPSAAASSSRPTRTRRVAASSPST